MENSDSSYRLERWIAVILGLLFFLPFVARADEILATGTFHGDEVKHASGEHFLALVSHGEGDWFLQPVSIRVDRIYDPIVDGEREATGKEVVATGVQDAILIRGSELAAGDVTAASPDGAPLVLGTTTDFRLGTATSTLAYHCSSAADPDGAFDCRLILTTGDSQQEIAKFEAFADEHGKAALPDLAPEVFFAGDLDHDGKLDLIIDIANHYNLWHPALYLSSAARDGALVAKVAELVTSGC